MTRSDARFVLGSLALVLAGSPGAARVAGDLTPDWIGEPDAYEVQFGTEFASGDFNGDGYLDLVVGGYSWSNGEEQEGAMFVYLGTATGLPATWDSMWESNVAWQHFGRVMGSGDINGDGYDDVIVGAPTNLDDFRSLEDETTVVSGSAGTVGEAQANGRAPKSALAPASIAPSAYGSGGPTHGHHADIASTVGPVTGAVFLFLGSPTGPSPEPDWVHHSHAIGDRFGRAAGSAGDVNGDGYEDLYIGAYYYENGEVNEGGVWLFHGSPDGPALEADWGTESNSLQAGFAWGAASAGDVNGDGYDDFAVGAPQFDAGQGNSGRAFVYHGSANGLSTSPDWIADGPRDLGAQFGRSIRGVGDVNGDGYGDLVAGARFADRDQRLLKEGAALLYHGSPTGLSQVPNWFHAGKDSLTVHGHAVGAAGDVNGDGFSDVVVGQPLSSDAGSTERVEVYLGSPAGLDIHPAWTVEGPQTGAEFGVWCSTIGDLDQDGLSDLAVGSWRYDSGDIDEGGVFLYRGATLAETPVATTGPGVAGDLDGDGRADLLLHDAVGERSALFLLDGLVSEYVGPVNYDSDPGWTIAASGDFNGDGRTDALRREPASGALEGFLLDGVVVAARAVLTLSPGPTCAVAATGDFDADGKDDLLLHDSATGEFEVVLLDGLRVRGGGALAALGGTDVAIDATGDLDADGTDDLLARHVPTGDVFALLMSGTTATTTALVLQGLPASLRLAGVGDFDGDGRDDLVAHDSVTGDVQAFLMDGASVVGTAALVTQPDTSWLVDGCGDFDGDGSPDLLWRSLTTGEARLSLFNGLVPAVEGPTDPPLDATWDVRNLAPAGTTSP